MPASRRKRRRRMSPRAAAIAAIVFLLCCAIVATGSLVAFRATSLAASLGRVAAYAPVLEKDVKATNLAALSTDIYHLDDLTQDLLVKASDPFLNATLDGLPVVGPNLDAARDTASAVAGLTSSLRPLASILPKLEPDQLVVDGRYDTTALDDLDTAMQGISDQLVISNKIIAGIPVDKLDSRFATIVGQLEPALTDAAALVDQLEPLVRILPIVLGDTQSRTWFVALQNLAEARGTGGIIGAYSVLDITDGRIEMTASGADTDLIPTSVPLDGAPDDLTSIWGDKLHEVRSTNLSPDFPDTGRLFANEWKAVSGTDVDGVLAIGQGTVQYMLAATGPITIDGSTVDAQNAVKFLSYDVYAEYPHATDKNAFVAQLVAAIFKRLQSGQFDLSSLLTASAATTTGDRIQAWSSDADLQAKIVAADLGGVLPTTYGPTTAVAINNGGGNKLEQYLHETIDYTLGTCYPKQYQRTGTMTITLTNDAPASGLPEYVAPKSLQVGTLPIGSNRELVSVYAPVNSGEYHATLDGKAVESYIGVESSRPFYVFQVDLKPGQTRTVTITWREPIAGPSVVDILGAQPSVITSPSLNPVTVTTPRAEVC